MWLLKKTEQRENERLRSVNTKHRSLKCDFRNHWNIKEVSRGNNENAFHFARNFAVFRNKLRWRKEKRNKLDLTVPFHVISLLANIPTDEVNKHVYEHLKQNNLPVDKIKQLLFVSIYCVQFKFKEEIYRQNDEVARRSSLEPIFTTLLMVKLDNSQLESYARQLMFYGHHVADIMSKIQTSIQIR